MKSESKKGYFVALRMGFPSQVVRKWKQVHECLLWDTKMQRQAHDILFSGDIGKVSYTTVEMGMDDVKNMPKSYCIGLWGDTPRNLTVNLSDPRKTTELWSKKIRQGMWRRQFYY